jgi:hypothetical protein
VQTLSHDVQSVVFRALEIGMKIKKKDKMKKISLVYNALRALLFLIQKMNVFARLKILK